MLLSIPTPARRPHPWCSKKEGRGTRVWPMEYSRPELLDGTAGTVWSHVRLAQLGGGQGCCPVSYNAQDSPLSPRQRRIQNVSSAEVKNPALDFSTRSRSSDQQRQPHLPQLPRIRICTSPGSPGACVHATVWEVLVLVTGRCRKQPREWPKVTSPVRLGGVAALSCRNHPALAPELGAWLSRKLAPSAIHQAQVGCCSCPTRCSWDT